MTTKTRREFTDEFKREAVVLLRDSGWPLTQVASELGLEPSVLRRWRSLSSGMGQAARAFASSDRHMVKDVGENPHVEQRISHGVADGVLARDDADGVERHALERRAVARAVVAPHE